LSLCFFFFFFLLFFLEQLFFAASFAPIFTELRLSTSADSGGKLI